MRTVLSNICKHARSRSGNPIHKRMWSRLARTTKTWEGRKIIRIPIAVIVTSNVTARELPSVQGLQNSDACVMMFVRLLSSHISHSSLQWKKNNHCITYLLLPWSPKPSYPSYPPPTPPHTLQRPTTPISSLLPPELPPKMPHQVLTRPSSQSIPTVWNITPVISRRWRKRWRRSPPVLGLVLRRSWICLRGGWRSLRRSMKRWRRGWSDCWFFLRIMVSTHHVLICILSECTIPHIILHCD